MASSDVKITIQVDDSAAHAKLTKLEGRLRRLGLRRVPSWAPAAWIAVGAILALALDRWF